MHARSLQLASVAVSILAAANAAAATFDVAVGQNTSGQAAFAFNPPTLTIHVNDSVRFTNFQNGFHNVDSTGGPAGDQFKCSVDCAANNTPNPSAWSDTVIFSAAGTVTYQCDQHSGFGMTGTITVLSSVPVRLQSFEVD